MATFAVFQASWFQRLSHSKEDKCKSSFSQHDHRMQKHPFLHTLRCWDVLHGGTFATQRQKFHTDDANQCLHNKSGSHGVPNINLSHFTNVMVDFGEVLCSSANELQQNSNASSREDLYSTNIDCFVRDSSCLHWTFVAFCLLSIIHKQ